MKSTTKLANQKQATKPHTPSATKENKKHYEFPCAEGPMNEKSSPKDPKNDLVDYILEDRKTRFRY